MAATNAVAKTLKALHQRANKPLVLANVYDILSARTVGVLPAAEALATASWAVAAAADMTDDGLTLEANLAAVRGIAAVAKDLGKPLTVDIQNAYGPRLEEAIGKLLDLGVVGVNIEDCDKDTGKLYDIDTAASRVRRVLDVAEKRNVPDFVVNARCDVLTKGGKLDEVLARGKKYLEAGATTVFVWGGSRGVSTAEVEQLVKAFGGRLNVIPKAGGLTIKELAAIGVARASVGPTLQIQAMAAYKSGAERLLQY
jgi:2-methylisocitrate lyase-like PEP mutase family enzyme